MVIAQEAPDLGEMILHHTADSYSVWGFSWHPWADVHIGGLAVNFTPTKHVFFMFLTAILVFLTMKIAGNGLKKQRAGEKAPTGFANAVEAMVIFVRDEIAIANIGHDGAKFAPFIMTLFFFILYANLIGLLPHGSTATGNLGITGGLALLTFFVVELSGFVKLGAGGYMRTIFPKVPGLDGVGGLAMSVFMAPIEILGKFVKPFALAVRLFGNMTAGHFVILSLFGIIFLFGHLAIFNWGIGLLTAGLVMLIMMLEIIIAVLQAYVFALLSAVFIGLMQHEH